MKILKNKYLNYDKSVKEYIKEINSYSERITMVSSALFLMMFLTIFGYSFFIENNQMWPLMLFFIFSISLLGSLFLINLKNVLNLKSREIHVLKEKKDLEYEFRNVVENKEFFIENNKNIIFKKKDHIVVYLEDNAGVMINRIFKNGSSELISSDSNEYDVVFDLAKKIIKNLENEEALAERSNSMEKLKSMFKEVGYDENVFKKDIKNENTLKKDND